MDYILNGQATGDVASVLMQNGFDPGALRPWRGVDGRSYVTVVQRLPNGMPKLFDSTTVQNYAKKRGLTVNDEMMQNMIGRPMTHNVLTNATATLRKDDWKLLDRAVMTQAKPRLKAFQDLRGIGSFVIPNGMGKTMLEYERMTDISPATVSMDGLRQGDSDRVTFDLRGLPLPITHKDFQFSLRQLETSRQGGTPLDTTNAGLAGEKVAEEIERTCLGISSQMISYGGYDVPGYLNFPHRLTYEIADPTDVAWTPEQTKTDVLRMKQLSVNNHHYGPWKLYVSTAWDEYLDDDYKDNRADTLRDRLMRIGGISAIETLDYLPGYDMILVQQTPSTARAVIAMEITTLQWPSHGGMQSNFKVMAIMVPQLRADAADQCGIVHGAPAEA